MNNTYRTKELLFLQKKAGSIILAAVCILLCGSLVFASENSYTPQQAASILHGYCDSMAASEAVSYIADEYLEDDQTYVVWWRSYTSFTVQYRANLRTGDVTESGPYSGKTPDEQLPFSEEYAFSLGDYEEYLDYDIDRMLSGVPVRLDEKFCLDLDRDGTQEDIMVLFDEDPMYEDGSLAWYYGKYWICVEQDNLVGSGDNLLNKLYGVSIDGETIDLIVFQEGPSDDPACDFYHYDKNGLIFAGTIDASVNNFVITPDHTIRTEIRSDIMETSRIKVIWEKREDGRLYMIGQPSYEVHSYHADDDPFYAQLLHPLGVYAQQDTSSAYSELQPQAVCFPYTDNRQWVYVQAEDGTGGWLDVSDWSYEDRVENFDGLLFAD